MKYEILWEINKFQIPFEAILSGVVVCIVIIMIFVYFDAYREEHKKEDLGKVIVLAGLFIIFAVVFNISVNNGGGESAVYAEKYYDGDYKIEEGVLEDFELFNMRSCYTVNGIEFNTEIYEELECGKDYIKIYYVEESNDGHQYVVRIDRLIDSEEE